MTPRRSLIGRAFAAWVAAVCRAAWAVAAICFVLVVLTGVYLKHNIAINTDTTDMLSAELPFRQNNQRVDELFPQLSDNILLVLDGAVPEQVDAAARALTNRLRETPQMFGEVFDPEGDPYLEKNGLLFLDLPELETLTGQLADAQPFLASLWSAPGLPTLFNLLKDGLTEGGAKPPGDLAGVMNRLSEVAERRAAGEAAVLSWQRLLSNSGEAEPSVRRLITLRPPLDFGRLQPASEVLAALDQLRKDLNSSDGGVRLRISGSVALRHDELKSVEQGMGMAGLISFVLVMVLLIVGLRRPGAVAAVLLTLASGLIWTAGFAIWAVGALNLISVAFAVLFIGLSVDFGIHFTLRYGEHLAGGEEKTGALINAAASGGGGLALCAAAAAIAFYSFLPTDYVGLAQLGVIAGTGMFIALAANLTLLPALLQLMPAGGQFGGPVGAAGQSAPPKAPPKIIRWIGNNPRPVLGGAALIAVAGLAFVPQGRFDFDPLNLQDETLQSVAVVHELAAGPGASSYAATVLADGADRARELAARLPALPEVEEVLSVHSFLPSDQGEKIEVVRDLSLFMLTSLSGDRPRVSSDPQARTDARKALMAALDQAAAGGGTLAKAAGRLARALTSIADGNLGDLENALLGTFPATADRLRRTLDPAPVSLETLPKDLSQRFVAKNGVRRLLVYPAEDLRDPDNLSAFVSAVRTIAPDASGSPVTIFEAGRTVLASFKLAGFIAVAAILALLAFVLRRTSDVLFVFAPLALAAVLTVAFSVIAAEPFNFANIIVLPLLFGLGVASGIHLVLRDRSEAEEDRGAFETSTPRAVMFSAFTTIGSFGSIAISGHPGTASMGVLLTVAIILTLACTMTVLPALLSIRRLRSPGLS